jgi:hypothetical protein
MLAINTVLIGAAAVQAAMCSPWSCSGDWRILSLLATWCRASPSGWLRGRFDHRRAQPPRGAQGRGSPGPLALATLAPVALAGAVLLWGFGLWWLAVVALVVVRAARTKGIPFSLGYWAFVFPPAAYALATLLLGQAVGWSWLAFAGRLLAGAVALGWLYVAVQTMRGVLSRRIFALPPSFREILPATSTDSGRIESHGCRTSIPSTARVWLSAPAGPAPPNSSPS